MQAAPLGIVPATDDIPLQESIRGAESTKPNSITKQPPLAQVDAGKQSVPEALAQSLILIREMLDLCLGSAVEANDEYSNWRMVKHCR